MNSIFARLTSLVLAVFLSVPLSGTALATETGFSDVPSAYWASDAIVECVAQGAVTGYADGTFHPDESVTYAQFLAMLTRTFYPSDAAAVTITDEQPWYYASVQVVRNKSLDAGTNILDKWSWPVISCIEKAITRYEMAQIIANMLRKDGELPSSDRLDSVPGKIMDWQSVPESYRNSVAICYVQGIITGMSDGSFGGTGETTRAQSCVIITRLLDLVDRGIFTPRRTVGKLANGEDVTIENVLHILDQLEKDYPTGTIWGSKDTLNNNTYTFGEEAFDVIAITNQWYSNDGRKRGRQSHTSTVAGCGGFAGMVSDAIFGQCCAPCREVTNMDDIRPGDILIKFTDDGYLTHVSIIRSVSKNSQGRTVFNTCDGNMSPDDDSRNGTVKWPAKGSTKRMTPNEFGTIYRVWTRYPN